MNTLQGDIPLDDTIFIMTTNNLELMDPALYRPGRVDVLLEIGPVTIRELNQFVQFYYETDFSFTGIDDIQILGSVMMGFFLENPRDLEGFKHAIKNFYKERRETKILKIA